MKVSPTGTRSPRDGTLARREAVYRDAQRYMKQELGRDLRLEEVAMEVATSPRQLQRVFAQVGGTTYRLRLRELRMQRAAGLLSEGLSPDEAAASVGYGSPRAFARTFEATFGRVPRTRGSGGEMLKAPRTWARGKSISS